MSHAAVVDAEEKLEQHLEDPGHFEKAIPLVLLVESGHNARHRFDPVKLEELASSIRQKGIVQPLVVRPFVLDGENRFEIVAGARRYRASKLAGRTVVPCIVREYTDSDVLELQIIENIQREDLDPLEEAAGYAALIESNPSRYSAAFIADRIGREEKYVWDRMRLLALIDQAKKLLDERAITVSHATALSRLTPAQQKTLVHPDGALWTSEAHRLSFEDDIDSINEYDGLKPISVKELEVHIANHVRFNPKQAAEVAPLEFGEVAQLVEAAEAKPGRGKKVIHITQLSMVPADARDENERTFARASWKRADGQDDDAPRCEHAQLGVVAVGPDYGQAFDVCTAKDKCDVHWGKERREKQRNEKLRSSGQEEKAAAREDKHRQEQAEAAAKIDAAKEAFERAMPALVEALISQVKKSSPRVFSDLVLTYVDRQQDVAKIARAKLPAPRNGDAIVRQAALIVLLHELRAWQSWRTFPRVAKRFGIDVSKILKAQAQKAKPTKETK